MNWFDIETEMHCAMEDKLLLAYPHRYENWKSSHS